MKLVTKNVDERSLAHFGVRLYLQSPPCLHNTSDDDDRSAITFGVPSAESFTPHDLVDVFRACAAELDHYYGPRR